MEKNAKKRVLVLTDVANASDGFSKDDFVCDHIAEEIMKSCCDHVNPLDCPDFLVVYNPERREYGLPVRDGENSSAGSYVVISHCPWCGQRLPENLSSKWFEVLEKEYGIDSPFDDPDMRNVPEEFKTDEWWKKRGL